MNWACTVKKKYFDAIIDGRKRFEVRKRIPKIAVGDTLFVCSKDEVIKCRIVSVSKRDKEEAWYLFSYYLCIEGRLYDDYLKECENVYLIGLRVIKGVNGKELAKFRSVVKRNPQWFSKVKF